MVNQRGSFAMAIPSLCRDSVSESGGLYRKPGRRHAVYWVLRWSCFSSLISSDEGQRCNLSPIISRCQSWFHWDDQLRWNELNIWNGQIPLMVRQHTQYFCTVQFFFLSGILFSKHLTVQVHLELWKHIWQWGTFDRLHEFLITWKNIQLSWVHFE